MKPLLSILVATKNRIPYCKNLIETVLKFKNFDFELIVQDNSDTLELKYFADNIADNRFKYNYTSPPFSSIDNFNKVIEMANGKYLCMIGDDDSINPDIFEIIKWANEKNIASIVPVLKAVYMWPDTCKNIEAHKEKNGVLEISKISGEMEMFSPTNEVKALMKNGAQNYLGYKLPKLYHGIILKEKMDAVKNITGFYIGGLSPDIYSAISLSFFVDKVYYLDFPLTMPGICTQSTSGDAKLKKSVERLEDAVHFRDRGEYHWSNLVPRFYCDENIWADTALAALTDLKQEKMLSHFNLASLTVLLMKKYQDKKDIILQNYYRNLNVNSYNLKRIHQVLLSIQSKKMTTKKLGVRILDKLKRKLSKNNFYIINGTEITNLKNVSEATDALVNYLSENNLRYDRIITNNTNKVKE